MTQLIANHIQRGLDVLLSQYRRSTKFKGLISAFLKQVQDLENASFACIVNRRLDSAAGVNLDQYGRVFNQPRNGLSDDEYRNVIKVRIAAYRGKGNIKSVTSIAAGLFGVAARYSPLRGPAYTISVIVSSVASAQFAQTAIDILFLTRPAGVSLADFLESQSGSFTFDTPGQGWDVSQWGTVDLVPFSTESGFSVDDLITNDSAFSSGFDSGFGS